MFELFNIPEVLTNPEGPHVTRIENRRWRTGINDALKNEAITYSHIGKEIQRLLPLFG